MPDSVPVPTPDTAAGCPSGIRCCEEGWLTCTEPPGHDPDFHRAPGHEWDDAMAREFAELEELVPKPFAELLAQGLARGGWLLGEALAGRPIRTCASSTCQWAGVEHYYGPGCPGCS